MRLRVLVAGAKRLSALGGEIQRSCWREPAQERSALVLVLRAAVGWRFRFILVSLRRISFSEGSVLRRLLIPEDWIGGGRCGLMKSRQHWLVMAGSGERVWGQPGRTRGRGDGDVGAEGPWRVAGLMLRLPWRCP